MGICCSKEVDIKDNVSKDKQIIKLQNQLMEEYYLVFEHIRLIEATEFNMIFLMDRTLANISHIFNGDLIFRYMYGLAKIQEYSLSILNDNSNNLPHMCNQNNDSSDSEESDVYSLPVDEVGQFQNYNYYDSLEDDFSDDNISEDEENEYCEPDYRGSFFHRPQYN